MRILYLAIVICLLLVVPCQADTLKIGECTSCDGSTVPDNAVRESDPHFNRGISPDLLTGWFSGSEFRTTIRFPLDQLALTGATITAATFGCEVISVGDGGNTTIEIHEIATANLGWIEGGKDNATATASEPDWVHFSHISPVTTWAGSAGLSTATTDYVTAVYGSFNGTSTGSKTATLSAAGITYLNNQIGSDAEFLIFTSDAFSGGEFTLMGSSERPTASQRPFLELTFTPVPTVDVFVSDQSGHVGFCEDNSFSSASTGDLFNHNRGALTSTFIGADVFAGELRIIQRYDLSVIPGGVTIMGAEIVMEATGIAGSGDITQLFQIKPANNDWVEGTVTDATEVGSSCWNDYAYENITEWAGNPGLQTPGTDFFAAKLTPDQTISTTGTKTFAFNVAGIASIQNRLFFDDVEFLFRNTTTTSSNVITFASSENATNGNRPYLKITHTVPADGAAAKVLIIRR